MPAEMLVTKDILAEDAVFVLQYLRENVREGRSTHMMDVRTDLANSVTLEFSDYLRFLRKFNYVALDREQHTLALTTDGDRTAQDGDTPTLRQRLEEFFAPQLAAGVVEVATEEDETRALGGVAGAAAPSRPPPPPPEDLTPAPGPLPVPRAVLDDPRPPGAAFASVLAGAADHIGELDELVYVRGEPLGQGPLGAVYAARHASLGIPLAVKEIREAAARRVFPDPAVLAGRIKVEAGAQARLRHPAIVQVHDLDVTVPQPFLVLELCEGGSLRDRLKRDTQGLAPSEALVAFGQLLSGLAAAHAAGVVHGNLKAENVLFDRLGNAKLGDFGFSRLVAFDLGDAQRQTVLDAGLVSYLAPELLQGGQATPATDVYALGIVLYELLTGRVPGRRSPEPSKASAGVPAELDEIFELMVADRADDRYDSAAAVLEDLVAAFPDGRYGAVGTHTLLTAAAAPAKAPAAPPSAPASAKRRK